MDAFPEKIMKYVDQHALLSPGDRIVVGLSGGADSVCLLLILQVISGKMPLSLCAVHVEHGIRGQEALEDTAFCRQLCETRGIPFREVHCDVPGMARREGLSLEEAGRKARYETFARVREEWGGTKIAVAHHREDQAETLLLHLFRGTHLAGMQGMRPRQGVIIRPLLDVSREEIEAWLCAQGVFWRTDSTNLTDDYARNRVRHRILPEARQINAAATAHLAEACDAIGEVMDYMEAEAERLYRLCRIVQEPDQLYGKCLMKREENDLSVEGRIAVESDCGVSAEPAQEMADKFQELERTTDDEMSKQEDGKQSLTGVDCRTTQKEIENNQLESREGVTLNVNILTSAPPVLARFALKRAYLDCCGQCKDVGAVHYVALMGLLAGETGKQLDLPHGVRAEKNYDRLTLYTTKQQENRRDNRWRASTEPVTEGMPEYSLPIQEAATAPGAVSQTISLPDGGRVTVALEDFKKGTAIPIKTYTKWLDYDTIKRSLVLRHRRPGDYLTINERGGRKKLKDYFIDEKIERRERDRLWLLADGSHVLWVIGGRMSAACRVTERTEKVLKIHADGGVWNE